MNNQNLLLQLLVLVFLKFSFYVTSEEISTTTRSYDLNVPGSDPIRIIEGEPLWQPDHSRSFTTDMTKTNLNNPINSDDDQFSNIALQEFLSNYAENVRRIKSEEVKQESPEEKSKSWNLLHVQKHNHPYDDKKGWVSLEPVPWSVSKISKWQSHPKPTEKPWEEPNEKPWDNEFENSWNQKPNFIYNKPSNNDNKYELYYVNQQQNSRPSYQKPSAIYGQKVHIIQSDSGYNHDFPRPNYKQSVKINPYYKQQEEDCKHDENGDIITDGLPPNFPHDTIQRRGSEIQQPHPHSHPFSGEGDWVLLSTTRGYKYPKTRQRSMKINPEPVGGDDRESVGMHRSVRLTVLPPLKGSKVNMTTSHGGLLQVESTFETVEQAKNKFVKRQKLKRRQKRKPQKPVKQQQQQQVVGRPVKQQVVPTVATLPRNTGSSNDGSAVLAAVGAGMIPATMAMLVPMAMNGRRRRDTRFVTSHPFQSIEITLPRNL